MALFNFNAASLSSAQTWVFIVVAGGMLGVSVFRENKAVVNIQDTRDRVIQQGVEMQYLKDGQSIIREEQAQMKADAEKYASSTDNLSGEIEILKNNQQEIINIGQYYIRNQDSLSSRQMQREIENWVKKNGWSPIVQK